MSPSTGKKRPTLVTPARLFADEPSRDAFGCRDRIRTKDGLTFLCGLLAVVGGAVGILLIIANL